MFRLVGGGLSGKRVHREQSDNYAHIYRRRTLTYILITLLGQCVCQPVCVRVSLDLSSPLTLYYRHALVAHVPFLSLPWRPMNLPCFMLFVKCVCVLLMCVVSNCVNLKVMAVDLAGVRPLMFPKSPLVWGLTGR